MLTNIMHGQFLGKNKKLRQELSGDGFLHNVV